MNHKITLGIARVLLFVALLGASAARADISSSTPPSVSTTTRGIVVGQPTTVTALWTVTRGVGVGCGPTVSSDRGVLRGGSASGPVLLTIPTTLTRTVACTAGTTTFTFVDRFLVPADVARRAQQLGFSGVVYTRTFTDGTGAPGSGTLSLSIVGGASGTLSIARLALAFDNGAPARVLARGEAVGAAAEVTYSGNGLLRAQWEIATPESTSGTPVYRVLRQVRQYLSVGDTVTLQSPPLPSDVAGLHLVRLQITDPPPGFEAPVIRYFVLQSRAARDHPGRAIALGSPSPRALFAPDMMFAWESIGGARAYQLEVYDTGERADAALPDLDNASGESRLSEVAKALSRPPVTGTLVSGQQARTVLSPVVRRHLLPNRRYLWRVLAIGERGSAIGVSPMRELRTP